MKELKATLDLNLVEKVKSFVTDCELSFYNETTYVKSGQYIVNAKSILGLLSLDLSKPVELIVVTSDPEAESAFVKLVKKYE